jgi:hypothetical protein
MPDNLMVNPSVYAAKAADDACLGGTPMQKHIQFSAAVLRRQPVASALLSIDRHCSSMV